jgi:hypothetical protein
MKSIVAALVCAGWILSSGSAVGADALDELLASEPTSSQLQPTATDVVHEDATVSLMRSSTVAQYEQSWAASVIPVQAPEKARGDATPQPKPVSEDASTVPEPSAVAIAGLALVYFLIFGRRRRIV